MPKGGTRGLFMFVGRERELGLLQKENERGGVCMAVLYGRPRVGKSSLAKAHLLAREGVYWAAGSSSLAINLESLRLAMRHSCLFPDALEDDHLTWASMARLVEAVFVKAMERPLVFVLDAYPRLARACPELPEELARLSRLHEKSRLQLILCGSNLPYMEERVLGEKSPFKELCPLAIKLKPLDFFTLHRHFKIFRGPDAAHLYGIVGGTVPYVRWVEGAADLGEILREHALNPDSRLFEVPESMVAQEIRESAVYNSILSAMARGYGRLTDLAKSATLESGACALYLNRLIGLNLARKEQPFEEENSRRSHYGVENPYFRFHFRYVPQNLSLLQLGYVDQVVKLVLGDKAGYMAEVFTHICRQWLLLEAGKSPDLAGFVKAGRWWGTDPRSRERISFDLAARRENGQLLLGKCLWLETPATSGHIVPFLNETRLYPGSPDILAVFASSGFDASCRALARDHPNLVLVSGEAMVSRAP